ncbi:hypothetical protein [Pelagibius sp.]|uniref:hypothetical protein n=1 Tax=Pelagibius sp. TaxID=1931238 RepID=UPI0026136DF6|nr:hypothetical protein [Pelagibius sp.]
MASVRPLEAVWQEIAERPAARHDSLAISLAGQFLQGEELTALTCSALRDRLPLASARASLALQGEDEHRHAALYRRYLEARGARPDAASLLAPAAERFLAWQGPPEAILLALHVIIEGEALAFQEQARHYTNCPSFAALSRLVAADEARHVAFGRIYLPAALWALTPSEKQRIHEWLRALWFECSERLPQVLPRPWLGRFVTRHWAERRWDHWQAQLAELGLPTGNAGRQ